MTLEQLRADLVGISKLTFLNYAATSPLLSTSADLMRTIINENLQPLGLHFNDWLGKLESSRGTVARFINASPEGITFTTNTSTALSLAALSITWKAGDRIAYFTDEFPSNRYCWQNIANRFSLELVPIERKLGQSHLQALESVSLESVRLLSISAISYLDGVVADIKQISKIVHEHHGLICVDAIQQLGQRSVDVKDWDCDFLASGGQKWLLGPVGSGFLYIKPTLLNECFVATAGWASHKFPIDFQSDVLTFTDGARRFEAGLPNLATIVGLKNSIEVIEKCGTGPIEQHIQYLRDIIVSNASIVPGNLIHDATLNKSGIITFDAIPSSDLQHLIEQYAKRDVILTARNGQLRIAVHGTSTANDLDILFDAIGSLGKHHKKFEPIECLAAPKKPGEHEQKDCSWAIITGANQGLGKALAIEAASQSYNILLIGRQEKALNLVQSELMSLFPTRSFKILIGDLTKPEDVNSIIEELKTLDHIGVLINNAASGTADLTSEVSIDTVHQDMQINFITPLMLSKYILLRSDTQSKHIGIINILTSGARCAFPLFGSYAASKGALWSATESMIRENKKKHCHIMGFVPKHMSSTTQQGLGRKALAYYKTTGASATLTPSSEVARNIFKAYFKRKTIVMPFSTRMQQVVNVLAPNFISSLLKRKFKS